MSATEHVALRSAEAYLTATAALRPLPDFLIIGTQRGGTTSMYRYLAAHPQVMPTLLAKGVHYFDSNASRSASWYRGHFPASAYRRSRERRVGGPVVTGEASPYYLFHPHAPARAAALVPQTRLIVMLREPAARARSQYAHEVGGRFEPLSTFEEALAAEPARLTPEEIARLADPHVVSFAHQHFSYVARGRYAEQLRRWFSFFPREQVLVLGSERFFADPASQYAAVTDFLGLERFTDLPFRPYNATDGGGMAAETGVWLRETYARPNAELFDLLGGDDLGWGR
jgi:hypothetical protein